MRNGSLPRSCGRTFCRRVLVATVCAASASMAPPARADYPIASHRYLADPGSLVYDGRIYLYNSNDDDNAVGGGYTMHSVVCVSTTDLKNWTDHGIVFQVPADAKWASNSWAPQAIAREGKIFLYFGNSGSGVGVASSTNPVGTFKDAKGNYLVNGSTPGASGTNSWLFDPGALIDDDGQAYLSFGGNGEGNPRIIKLGSDLTSVSGSAAKLTVKGFFEASFLFKRKNIYYFSYSSDSANGMRIDYLTSSSPMSGYTYQGVLAGQPPNNNNNNHASQFEYKGQWYHAYHNRIVASQAGISTTYKRNLAIEVLNFNDDGLVKQVTYTTDGVPQVGTLNPYARVEAETTNAQSGIETETCSEGGMQVTSIHNGDWIKVRGVDFGSAGAKKFTARVASAAAGGAIEVRLGSATGTLVATCSVPNTGGNQTWADATCDVTGATGTKDVTFKFTGSGSTLFNFNYWQFTGGDGPVDGGAGGSPGTGGAGGTGGSGGMGGAGGTGGGTSSGGTIVGDGGAGGTASSGGVVHSGGTATGGQTQTGGNEAGGHGGSATGGVSSTAGASGGKTSTGGATATGGASGEADPTTSSDSGCSCRMGTSSRAVPAWVLPFALLLALRLRRRFRR